MPDLKDRRVIFFLAAGLTLVVGVAVAVVLMSSGSRDEVQTGVDAKGGLVVQTGRDDDIKLDPKGPIGCFVGGKRIGDVPLSECAKRNGVAAGALDVGLDQNGVLAAGSGPAAPITPLPSPSVADLQAQTAPAANASDTCWRRTNDGWSREPTAVTLDACVQALFAGRCLEAGADPALGRWGAKTLRLEPGEVDLSDDNHDFRPIVVQLPDCSIPAISSAG